MNWDDIWNVLNKLGIIVGVIGFPLSLVGLRITYEEVQRSKRAALQAKEIAENTRLELLKVGTIYDFSQVISSMEEIRRIHRAANWSILPDRYSYVKSLLVGIKGANNNLKDEYKKRLQGILVRITKLEEGMEHFLATTGSSPNVASANMQISKLLDDIHEIVAEIKSDQGV